MRGFNSTIRKPATTLLPKKQAGCHFTAACYLAKHKLKNSMNDPHIADYHDFSYDDSFSEIPYLPWVGRNYASQASRILIVPESVYDWDQGSSVSKDSLSKATFVRHCVREIGLHSTMETPWKGSDTQRLYRGIERLIWNARVVAAEQQVKLWTSVAFHELVQRPLENKDARPNREDWKAGAKTLSRVIETLKPNLCIFLGTDIQKMKALEEEFKTKAKWSSRKINGAYPKTLSLASMDCNIVMVKHPSERFSYNLWSDYLMENAPDGMHAFRNESNGLN